MYSDIFNAISYIVFRQLYYITERQDFPLCSFCETLWDLVFYSNKFLKIKKRELLTAPVNLLRSLLLQNYYIIYNILVRQK